MILSKIDILDKKNALTKKAYMLLSKMNNSCAKKILLTKDEGLSSLHDFTRNGYTEC